jgi:hypothetical protein
MSKTWKVEELDRGFLVTATRWDPGVADAEETAAIGCPLDVVEDLLAWLRVYDYELVRKEEEEKDVEIDIAGS